MLAITRKAGEAVHIGDDVKVVVLDVSGGKVRLGIDAPGKRILRAELGNASEVPSQETPSG